MLNTLNLITTNLPDARKYVNWPVKHQNDKGVKFNTFDTSYKMGYPGQNCHLQAKNPQQNTNLHPFGKKHSTWSVYPSRCKFRQAKYKLKLLDSITANLLEARKYLNSPAKPKNGKGV